MRAYTAPFTSADTLNAEARRNFAFSTGEFTVGTLGQPLASRNDVEACSRRSITSCMRLVIMRLYGTAARAHGSCQNCNTRALPAPRVTYTRDLTSLFKPGAINSLQDVPCLKRCLDSPRGSRPLTLRPGIGSTKSGGHLVPQQ